jgi:hypothetical protein
VHPAFCGWEFNFVFAPSTYKKLLNILIFSINTIVMTFSVYRHTSNFGFAFWP